MSRPVVLIIRDGWGTNPHPEHDAFNAVKLAKTPIAHQLMKDWPTTHVITCGEDVGLPAGTMGNSEVGHQNIGAGRIVDQELMRITRAIRDGSFYKRPAFLQAIEHARKNNTNLHLLGLLSSGHVHSDIEHLYALLNLIERDRFPGERVFIHVITDGRDVGPNTGLGFINALETRLAASRSRNGASPRIASVCGRYYAMDRDNRWERVAWAYGMLSGRSGSAPDLRAGISGAESRGTSTSAIEAVQRYYDHPSETSRTGDEFVLPTRIVDASSGKPLAVIDDGDSVIFYNFRGDRPREMVKAFMLDDAAWKCVPNALQECGGFDRGTRINDLFFATMSGYEKGLPVSAIAFEKPVKMPNILGEVVSNAEGGLTQFRCAETEKFPHVTFFFDDYRDDPFPGTTRELIQSPKDVTTYDQKPEMSAAGVCDAVLRRLHAAECEPLMVVNFANPDMVGHTGKLDAAIKAVEVVDACVGKIVDATLERGGSLVVMADHGNAEQMWDPINNCPHTSHTVYDVPVIVVGDQFNGAKLRRGGRLADIAPTVLAMMDLPQPAEMTGRSLIESAASRPRVI